MNVKEIEEKLMGHASGNIGRIREFSVLIPLIKRENDICILYQVRGADIKRQPGEISFPGGAMEPGESSAECAVRETCEELGIQKSDIHTMHEIGRNHTWRGDVIHVFSGYIDGSVIDSCSPSEVEVAKLFEVPLGWLLSYEPEIHMAGAVPGFIDGFDESSLGYPDGYAWGKLKNEVPVYRYGEEVIWGITGRITRYFIEILRDE